MPGESVPQGLWLPPRTATLVVAASNSSDRGRAQADYVCDGVNDHIEIQAALDALPATGGEVFLLDGTYYIESSLILDSYQTLRGCGRNTILTTTTADLDIITATGGAGSEKVGILIADLCVDGNAGGVANDIGILWTYVDHSKIEHVWSQDNGEDGISFNRNCDFNQIAGNTCQANLNYGIYIYTSNDNIISNNICQGNSIGIYIYTSSHNTINGNTCQGSSTNGIYLRTACNNNTVVGNTCQGNGYGVWLDTSNNNTVVGNTCQGNGDHGIGLYSSNNNTIVGNTCVENSQDTDNNADNIYLADCDYNLIASNLCRQGALANRPRYGINISNDTCDKNIVQGNDLHDAGKTANFNDVGTCTIVKSDNREIEITQVKDYAYVKNTSGGDLVAGDVVSHKAVAAGNEVTTPAAVGEDQVFGMLGENIVNNAYGYVQVGGKTTLLKATNAGGNIAIGDFLCTEIGNRARLAAAADMAFAISLEDCDAVDQVIDALLIVPRKI